MIGTWIKFSMEKYYNVNYFKWFASLTIYTDILYLIL